MTVENSVSEKGIFDEYPHPELWIPIVVILILILVNIGVGFASPTISSFGQFGDGFGWLNPIISLATLVGLYRNVLQQRKLIAQAAEFNRSQLKLAATITMLESYKTKLSKLPQKMENGDYISPQTQLIYKQDVNATRILRWEEQRDAYQIKLDACEDFLDQLLSESGQQRHSR
ncbi:MAG TPA: hypothetical protein VIZ65_16275 [Cellvibrionaceae bacterium]